MHGVPVPLAQAVSGTDVTLLVGPEGDFTEGELGAAMEVGAHCISLGARTFRAEVAAVLGAALIAYELGGLGPLRG